MNMDETENSGFGWEHLQFDQSALEKISVSPGQFVISASGVVETNPSVVTPCTPWQIDSIDLEICTFFREVVWIADCVRGALKAKKGIIKIGPYEMHVARISIRDHFGNLVFAAKFKLQDDQVDWISPCRTAQEEQSVAESVGKILAEANFEREWANHAAAKELEIYAHQLMGKLTHAKWREPMQSLLSLKRKFS
ncbi:hypothetical protein NS337_20230 [Pseudomonas oryzihabitans]|nr:hypothetical protein NS337_20230 [Pseudomonas psychrotolerans]